MFRLALALGCTVEELGVRLTARELTEWMAYFRLEPWGEERADWRSGLIASILANQWAGKDAKLAKPEDFVPDFIGERREAKRLNLADSLAWAKNQGG